MTEISNQSRGHVLGVHVSGPLTADDYARVRSVLSHAAGASRTVRLLVHAPAAGHPEPVAAGGASDSGPSHPVAVERLALVGDGEWHTLTAWLDRLFVPDEVRSFSEALLDEAWAWVLDGADASHS